MKKILFDERIDLYDETSLYFKAPKDIFADFAERYPEAEYICISMDFPKEQIEPELADIMATPVEYNQHYAWQPITFSLEEIKDLIGLAYANGGKIPFLAPDLFTQTEFDEYVKAESIRQWAECQQEKYGPWNEQSEEEKQDYINDMASHLADTLGKACCDCCYLAEQNEKLICNCKNNEFYHMQINARNYCSHFTSK